MTSELIDEVFENPSQKITFLSIPLKQSTKNLHDIVEKNVLLLTSAVSSNLSVHESVVSGMEKIGVDSSPE